MKFNELLGVILGIGATILFTGIALNDPEQQWTRYVLVVLGLLLLLVGLVSALGKHALEGRFKLLTTGAEAKAALTAIYAKAQANGGILVTTHVHPKPQSPEEDESLRYLSSVQEQLEFKRLLVLEDKLMEERWVEQSLVQLGKNVLRTIYVLREPFILSPVVWSLIPRANILLYSDGKKFVSLLGLGRIKRREGQFEDPTFTVLLPGKRPYRALYGFHQSLVANSRIAAVSSAEEYAAISRQYSLTPSVHSAIASLNRLADGRDEILHVGIFGRMAQVFNRWRRASDREERESDLDVMVVVKHGCTEKVRTLILDSLGECPDVAIVWGDDDEYFYEFREQGKITLDVEIKEEMSTYYLDHALLGISIFSSYFLLYSADGAYVCNLMELPDPILEGKDRLNLLREDRKGLLEFREHLANERGNVDPRRVISIVVRNAAWAISGCRPASTEAAMRSLKEKWIGLFPSRSTAEVLHIISLADNVARREQGKSLAVAANLVDDALIYCSRPSEAAEAMAKM